MNNSLKLSEDEQSDVMVPLELWHGEVDAQGYYLVGRLLGRRHFNFEALKTTLHNPSNLIRGLNICLIEGGRILFTFDHILDRKRVMDGGPWAFEKNLLILKPIDAYDKPARTDLN
ncbi:hypothetical protein Salat_0196100 [Sesamum alatum]|uniref:DUF4283 domain-containing protein n=1 Tax=Sesamum alatum TaxID=300844 RepID=A0AAE1YZK0_9LAMI|nr:hypothetical protein Salat_0196100 [Sesamum alatum]